MFMLKPDSEASLTSLVVLTSILAVLVWYLIPGIMLIGLGLVLVFYIFKGKEHRNHPELNAQAYFAMQDAELIRKPTPSQPSIAA